MQLILSPVITASLHCYVGPTYSNFNQGNHQKVVKYDYTRTGHFSSVTLYGAQYTNLLSFLLLLFVHCVLYKDGTFSLARCSKQTKQIGTERLFVIWVESLEGSFEYIAQNSTDCGMCFFVDVMAVLALST